MWSTTRNKDEIDEGTIRSGLQEIAQTGERSGSPSVWKGVWWWWWWWRVNDVFLWFWGFVVACCSVRCESQQWQGTDLDAIPWNLVESVKYFAFLQLVAHNGTMGRFCIPVTSAGRTRQMKTAYIIWLNAHVLTLWRRGRIHGFH